MLSYDHLKEILLKKKQNLNQNTPGAKKVADKNRKDRMKRCEIKLGNQRPPAVDEIKIFDDDDKATKHSFSLRMFCGLVSLSKILISSTSRRPWLPN